MGLATLYCTLALKADVILDLTALMIIPAYALSIIALLFNKEEWRNGGNIMALAALASAGGLIWIGLGNIL